MKKKIIIIGILVIAVVAVILNTQKNDTEELTLGVIAGLSGEYASAGEGFVNGVKLAQEEWNTNNPDKTFQIIVEDDAFEPKKGLSAYQKLVSIDKIDGLINMTTFTIDAIEQEIVSKNMPTAQGFIQTSVADDNIVQLWPGADSAEIKLGEYIRDQGYKNVVLFVSKDSAAFTLFADKFKEGYDLPLTEIKVGSDSTEIRSAALKAKELKPDAIVYIITGEDGGLLVREIENIYGSEEKPQYVFDANIQVFIGTYGKILGDTNKLNGSILYTVPLNYTSEFSKAYTNKFGIEPTVGSETGYNSFMLIAQSYDSNQNKWVKNMKTASFVGADGQIKLDETGTRIPDLKIGRIENGQLPE